MKERIRELLRQLHADPQWAAGYKYRYRTLRFAGAWHDPS